MLENNPSSGAPLRGDSNATLLTPSEPVEAVVAQDPRLAAGSRSNLDTESTKPADEATLADDDIDSPVAESAILAELDDDLRFADFEKAHWLPARPLITDPQRHIGSVFGAYRVLELLGKGGMGYVYRAEHIKLGRPVALKLLRTDYGTRKDAITRFFREAKTVNRIRHRNIIDVTDFVELGDGTAFIIMELLQGQSFGKWARTGVDLRRALSVLVQICDGLGAAHTVGVIHRDLKPDNIVVIPLPDGSELVKLLDFGVAKLTQSQEGDASYDTQVGALVGTPAYMSPEQAGGMVIDHRSDIYSLGALMYELFCNRPMFRGRSFGEYVRKHLTEVPTLPRSTPAGAAIPVPLELIIMRCLAKDPNARYETSFNLRDDLLGVLASLDRPEARPFTTLAFGSQTTKLPFSAVVLPASPATPAAPLAPALPAPPAFPLVSLAPALPAPAPQKAISRRSWWIAGSLIAIGGSLGAWWIADDAATQPMAVVKATMTEPIAPAPNAAEPSVSNPHTVPQRAPVSASQPPLRAAVELRFNSKPSGRVFAAGHTAELCRTPCSFNVDPKGSGSTNSRTFIVRSPGYREQPITIDLGNPQRDYYVELARLPRPEPSNAAKDPAPRRLSAVTQKRSTTQQDGLAPPWRPASTNDSDPEALGTFTFDMEGEEAPPPPPEVLEDVVLKDTGSKRRPKASAQPPESPTQGIAPTRTHNPFRQ